MFDFGKLDSKTMAAFKESSAKIEVTRSDLKMPGIVSTDVRTIPAFLFCFEPSICVAKQVVRMGNFPLGTSFITLHSDLEKQC